MLCLSKPREIPDCLLKLQQELRLGDLCGLIWSICFASSRYGQSNALSHAGGMGKSETLNLLHFESKSRLFAAMRTACHCMHQLGPDAADNTTPAVSLFL